MLLMFSKNLVANEKIVLGLSQDEVAITANFDGSNLTAATWTNGQTCGPESIGTCKQ